MYFNYINIMKFPLRLFFSFLSKINKFFLPTLSGKNMSSFNKFQFVILGYKYWVTKNYLNYRK